MTLGPVHYNWCNTPDIDKTLEPEPNESDAHYKRRCVEQFTADIYSNQPKPCE